jgi:hypothetical protein
MGHLAYERTDLRYGFRLEDGEIVVEAPSEEQIAAWRDAMPPSDSLPPTATERVQVRRIVIEVMDAAIEMRMEPWLQEAERLAHEARAVIMRVSPVPPHVRALPLTLPIRILEVGEPRGQPLSDAIARVFGGHPPDRRAAVVETLTCSTTELWSGAIARQAATLDVIHVRRFAVREDAELHLQIRDLGRLMDEAQTRLLVLETASDALPATRVFAQRLVARGGPAVVVMPGDIAEAEMFVSWLYENLIHDRPIDWILAEPGPFYVPGWPWITAFAGSGREELLRVSRVGLGLLELVTSDPRRAGGVPLPFFSSDVDDFAEVHREIHQLMAQWQGLRFEDHEIQGAIPLAESLGRIRSTWPRTTLPRDPKPPKPRRLLADFHDLDGRARPEDALLHADERVLLGLQIAPGPAGERHLLVPPIVEEQLKWSAEGAWMQIGVTGIDFDVLGDPVQDLLLPRTGSSDRIHFAVVPRRTRHAVPGFARLRYTLYHENRVLQSFLLAARLADGEHGATRVSPREGYARALSIEPDALEGRRVAKLSFLSRLEYAEATLADDDFTQQPRSISIVANHSDGTPVITVKTNREFEVQIPRDLDTKVEKVRRALRVISSDQADHVPARPDLWPYRFENTSNNVTPEQLAKLLPGLAAAGWDLYSTVLSRDCRKELEQLFAGKSQIIQVAHVLLDDVIPWAAIYSEEYDPRKKKAKDGQPVAHATCLAALPDAKGQMPEAGCGQAPDCLLAEGERARRAAQGLPRLLPETVACPRHFWGFRHIIEIPPRQVTATRGKDKATTRVSTIACEQPVRLVAGMHAKLKLAKTHEEKLRDVLAKNTLPCKLATESVAHGRDDVIYALQAADVDVAYLYCHAHPKVGNADDPHLAFDDGDILPSDLDAEPWSHHPLVILNGCETVGFRPDALSPFITRFVRDRQASGLLGTEVVVFETFASEFALLFLERFLQGRSAGDALLEVRRILLARRNPLGLVYTLYAAAELSLAPGPPPGPPPGPAGTSD